MSADNNSELISWASRLVAPIVGGIRFCFHRNFGRLFPKKIVGFCDQEQSIISKLPRKIRIKIWELLHQNQIMQLRLVCRLVKQDVEYGIGVTAIIDDESKYSITDKSIGVRNCTVITLKNYSWTSSWYFLYIPEILERMVIESSVVIEPEIVDVVLTQFNNLKVFNFVCENWIAGGNAESLAKTTKTLKFLARKEILTHLTVQQKVKLRGKYYICYLHWETRFKKKIPETTLDSRSKFPTHLIYLELLIPTLHDNQKQVWLDVIRNQTNLVTLSINLGYVYWTEYGIVVRNNQKTLDTVYLLNVGGWNEILSMEDPFDFSIFESCYNIREIILTAAVGRVINQHPNFSSYYYMPIVNLDRLPSMKLESITLLWMFLTQKDIHFIQACGVMEKPWKGFLLGCQGGFINEQGIVITASLGGSFINNTNIPESVSKYQLRSYIYGDPEELQTKLLENYYSVPLQGVCEAFKHKDLFASLIAMMFISVNKT